MQEQAPARRASVVFTPELAGAAMPSPGVGATAAATGSAARLSEAERDFFVEHGFFVRRRMVDAARIGAVMERVWAQLLARVPPREGSGWQLSRSDRATWRDPQFAPLPPTPESGPYAGRHPVEYLGRSVKLHDIGADDDLCDLLPRDASVRAVAASLLGGDLRPTRRVRGVYALFPPRVDLDATAAAQAGKGLGPHTDKVCQQLNVCVYLDAVRPRCGGFTVWPGSHRRLFAQHASEANWSPLPGYADAVRAIVADTTPWEIAGERGDVIFWHGRLLHSAGVHVGDDIRFALFADFMRDGVVLDDDAHRARGLYEWFKDTRLYRDDAPVTDNMWRHWRLGRD